MLAAYDRNHDRVVMYGGLNNVSGNLLSETWALDLSQGPQWQSLATAGAAPPFIVYPGGGYDARRNRLIVAGGYGAAGGLVTKNEFWILDMAGTPTWSYGNATGTGPGPPRGGGEASQSWCTVDYA